MRHICGHVNTDEETFSHPYVLHNEMVLELDHPRAGKANTVGMPVKFSKTASRFRVAPFLLGEHTNEVLSILGYSEEDIQRLRENKVVR